MTENPVTIGPYRCGRGQPLLVIAGPCVIEDATATLAIAERLRQIADGVVRCALVFKASFDKANRTSIDAYRGPGLDCGLEILRGSETGDGAAGDHRHPLARTGGGRSARCATCCRFPPFSPGKPICWLRRRPRAGRYT